MTISWERLNAYVDAELDPASAADVAEAIARDPDLAARAAKLFRLKASVQASGAALTEVPPFAPMRPRPVTRRWSIRSAPAVAAALLLLAVAVGFGTMSWWRSLEEGWPAEALAAERMWLDSGGDEQPIRTKVDTPLAMEIPDLTAADLRVVYVSAETGTASGNGLFVGYRGDRGCRFGLWIGAARTGDEADPKRWDTDRGQIRTWRTGEIGYAFLARGSDPVRFDRLADVVARITHQPAHPGEDLRTALREATQSGKTCPA